MPETVVRNTLALPLSLSLLLMGAGQAWAAAAPAPPAAFAKLVPLAFPNGLKLVDVRARCKHCSPWRSVEFYSNGSPTPVRQEQVSVVDGVTAMYAFPGTQFFANTKIERSAPGRFAQDKAIVIEAAADLCARMKERVAAYVDTRSDVRDKVEHAVAKGRQYIEFGSGGYHGYEYVACTQNVLGLLNGPISQVQIFVPRGATIVTAYLLPQKKAKFQNIDEFLVLQRAFIEGYIDFLQTP